VRSGALTSALAAALTVVIATLPATAAPDARTSDGGTARAGVELAPASTGLSATPSFPMLYTTRLGTVSCAPLTKTISGTIEGADLRAVNAQISFDLKDGAHQAIDGQGCRNDPGYGLRLHVNYAVSASGIAPGDAGYALATTTWTAQVPANTTQAYIEVYPERSSSQPRFGVTDKSHYGMSMWPKVSVYANTQNVALVLPTNVCSDPHATGEVVGYFKRNGAVVTGIRASAFSEAKKPADPLASGPLGMGIWNGNATRYSIIQLASGPRKGQPYIIFGRLADGTNKRFLMYDGVHNHQSVGVHACQVTRFDLTF
jgi:hypothetical protein